jgi:autotransporter family porin
MWNYSWFGGTGEFTNPDNWANDMVPSATASVSVGSGDIECSGNQLGMAVIDGPVTLDLSGGGLTLSPAASAVQTALDFNGTGQLTVTGGNSLTTTGIEDGYNDSLTVTDGASLVDQMIPNSNGIADLTLGDLTLENGGSFSAPGTLQSSFGSNVLTIDGGTLAVGAVTYGPLMMTGGAITVSQGDFGASTIAGGTIHSAGNLIFQSAAVSGGAVLSAAGTVEFGGSGNSLAGGSSVTAATFEMNGTIDAANVTVTSFSIVGTITHGAQISSANSYAGNVTVSGGGTRWTNKGTLTFGSTTNQIADGAGVAVENGAQDAAVNELAGTLTITGDASRLSDAGDMVVATSGTAALAIQKGGMLAVDGNLDIAQMAGSSGTLTLNGASSVLSVGTLTIGDGGIGSVSLSGGGTLGGSQSGPPGARAAKPPEIILGAQAAPAGGVTDPVTGLHVTYLNSLEISGFQLTAGDVTVGRAGYGGILFNGQGSALTSDDMTLAKEKGSEGQVIVDGTDASLTTQDLTIGDSGKALLTIGSGNLVTTNGDATLAENAGSQGSVIVGDDSLASPNDASGADWTVMGDLVAGGSGSATLTVSAGNSLATFGDATLAEEKGSKASVVLGSASGTGQTTGGADWSVSGNLTVADGGKASLSAESSSLQVGGATLTIGDQKGSNGLLTMSGSQLQFAGTLTIGDAGNGELLFQLGSTSIPGEETASPSITLGEQQGSAGTLIVTGQGTQLQANMLEVGAFGKGNAQITGGAQLLVTGDMDVAADAEGLVDSVTVSGTSTVAINGALSVGSYGVATLQVNTEAQLDASGGLTIGENQGGSAVVTVNGTSTVGSSGSVIASSILFGTSLTVGESGVGTLLIQAGAVVSHSSGGSGAIELGAKAGASGAVTLQGTGSALQGTSLDVGGTGTHAGGGGVLSVASGAVVDLTSATIWSGGQVKLSGGTLQAGATSVMGGQVSGYGTLAGSVADNGKIVATGGTLDLSGGLSGTGHLEIGAGGTLLLGGTDSSLGISFISGASKEVLTLAKGADLGAKITDFIKGDTILLDGFLFASDSYVGNKLILKGPDGTIRLDIPGQGAGDFTITNTASGTSIVADAATDPAISRPQPPSFLVHLHAV